MSAGVRGAIERAREVAWANPSSVHAAGRAARAALEEARRRVAEAIGAAPADVVFTAGGTEACNLGVLGLWPRGGRRVVTTRIEHPAVAEAVAALEEDGAEVIRLDVLDGRAPSIEALDAALDGASLACIGWVSSETGTILPVDDYARRCRARGVPLFVDATQALGKIPLDVASLGASAAAFAASKIGGPPGAGALWIARDAALAPRALGGAQERGRRAGTADAALLAGFGEACEHVRARLAAMPEVARRRDRLERALVERGAVVNGAGGPRVATVTDVSVPGWRGQLLVAALDLEGLATSSGAACSSGVDAPSPVVLAMYPGEPWRAQAALRLSLSPETTDAEIDRALSILERVLSRRR